MTDPIKPALTETWRPVEGHGGVYEVSDVGRVRRLAGPDSIGRPRRARTLRQAKSSDGYKVVTLCKNAKAKTWRVHRLVATAFHGAPSGRVVNHINGDKLDNRPENLEWVTPSENDLHAVSLGLKPVGARHWCAKLTTDDVHNIRRRWHMGETFRAIAMDYGVNESTVSRAAQGLLWANL